MKTKACAVLAAALALIAAGPAAAAADLLSVNMGQTNEVQAGTFAGFRLRMSLGGRLDEPRLRGGFTVAPTLHSRSGDGAIRLRMGEGMEFGLRSSGPLAFSIGGTQLTGGRQPARPGSDASHLHGSTAKILVIGGVVVLAVGAALFWHALDEASQ